MRAFLVLLMGVLMVPSGLDGQKTPVRVVFHLEEPSYARHFDQAQLKTLEDNAAELLAEKLGHELTPLSLSSAENADYVLDVSLARRGGEQSVDLSADRGLVIRLIGPDSTTEESWWVTVREGSATGSGFEFGDDTPTLDLLLLRLISLAVDRADLNTLVADHLSIIPLAPEGRIWDQPSFPYGWVAAIDRRKICMGIGTTLRFHLLVPNDFNPGTTTLPLKGMVAQDFDAAFVFGEPVPPEFAGFEHAVFSKPDPGDQEGLEGARMEPGSKVGSVFLLHFLKDDSVCQGILDPLAAEGVGGGS